MHLVVLESADVVPVTKSLSLSSLLSPVCVLRWEFGV